MNVCDVLKKDARKVKEALQNDKQRNSPIMISFSEGHILNMIEIMSYIRRLCPWNKEQTHQSFVANIISEVGEMAEAVLDLENETIPKFRRESNLCEELGDVLICILLHCQTAKDEGQFTFEDICEQATRKLIRRHPHVFTDEVAETLSDARHIYLREKATELADREEAAFSIMPSQLPH